MSRFSPWKARKGFTLIELMIVIVILGVLMGTILPRLSSAQARSRDLGRVADINSLAQALETYFDDYGLYPGTNGTIECLVSGQVAHDAIDEYLKTFPVPPASQQAITVNGTLCTGSYLYAPLSNRGLSNTGYILAIDMETYQNSNFLRSNFSGITWGAATDVKDITPLFENSLTVLQSKDNTDKQNTIYVVVN